VSATCQNLRAEVIKVVLHSAVAADILDRLADGVSGIGAWLTKEFDHVKVVHTVP
jgi:hypothetical protein